MTGRTYAVILNDYPQGIAKKLGAFPSRPSWWAEIKGANPQKQSGPKGWKTLNAGEVINIPDEWPPSSLLRAAPGVPPGAPTPPTLPPAQGHGAPSAPVPPLPGPTGPILPAPTPLPGFVPLAATVDPGTIARIHSELAVWSLATPGACNPADFGRGPDALADVSGVLTERAQHATQSFQIWANAQGRRRKLRSDGALDPATAVAINTWFRSKATPPGPMPLPGPLPLPGPEAPRGEQPAPRAPEGPRVPRGPGVPRGPDDPGGPGGPPARRPSTTVPAVYREPPPAAPPAGSEAPPEAKSKPTASASDDEVVGIVATLASLVGGFFL